MITIDNKTICFYIGLAVATIISIIVLGNGIMIMIDTFIILGHAIYFYIKDMPMQKQRDSFDSMFETINRPLAKLI